ncbi:methyltransferase domain-containing protein [Thermomonospora umbrina]|uniref:Protein-L-isoaspartate O-methyltransferase n=1 Tax=Thermomonospora umbrina TaxID=111806 RepID=A0A3D9SXH5_9ACTN|nr:methyltransferase domain-containing protein [Thermomonospora umbrina]REE96301.1 protein-L-isoaspartate(D-aspartate) O-methyltransferase [Thermomonospora umbrina]
MTDWNALLKAVPRHEFIPETVWIVEPGGGTIFKPLRRDDDPEAWRALCESDAAIITQVDDGAEEGNFPTSSSSGLQIMAPMLAALDPQDGMKILEIGTGTGYNAAVLATRLGPANVVSVEMDAMIADRARKALAEAGHPIEVITGDGTAGHPPRAPYDGVIATAAVKYVPYSWVEQTKPGGRIVLPLATEWDGGRGALLTLVVREDGTAEGRCGMGTSFMCLRSQRRLPIPPEDWDDDYDETWATVLPREPFDDDWSAEFAIGLALPGVRWALGWEDDDTRTFDLYHHETGSWAYCLPGETRHRIRQYGPRRLWDDLQTAHTHWLHHDRPARDRYGLTVTPQAQHAWLDHPQNIIHTV